MAQVSEIMTPGARALGPQDSVTTAAKVMRDLDIGVVPVCDGSGSVLGIVTDRDIVVRALAEGRPADTSLSEVMSADTCWCYEDEAVEQAAGHMRERQVRRMPVLDRRKNLVGMLSLGDVATHVDNRQAGKTLERVSEAARP